MNDTENTTPAPKKRGRPKKVNNTPKSEQAKANQAATQFQKGVSGNPGGKTFKRQTLEMREKMHQLCMEVGMPMLIQILYDAREEKQFKEALEVLTTMLKYAYGNPKDMIDIEEPVSNTTNTALPQIVVSREAALSVIQSDEDYT